MRSGDVTGPMAESGFKGHPQCRFCKSRFFGDGELYIHMQSAHEQCFLCRRAHPDRFIYYKDYNELEGKSKFLPWNRALNWPPCALRCASSTACGHSLRRSRGLCSQCFWERLHQWSRMLCCCSAEVSLPAHLHLKGASATVLLQAL